MPVFLNLSESAIPLLRSQVPNLYFQMATSSKENSKMHQFC